MRRLIDEAVLLDKHAEQCGEKSCDTCRFIGKEKCASYMAITETPTAYNVEEVVKELDDLKFSYFFTLANTGEAVNDFAYKNVGNAIDKAIEIVKGGVK